MISHTVITLLVSFLMIASVGHANFIAFSGDRCDGAGGAIVGFTGCTGLSGRHSFKFVDSLPYQSHMSISLWARSDCSGNENGYKDIKLNTCYNINTGGAVNSGRAYDYCHVNNGKLNFKECASIDPHAVKRGENEDEIIILEVDDSNSHPIFIDDDYTKPFNETIAALKDDEAPIQIYKAPVNSDETPLDVSNEVFDLVLELASSS